MKQQITNGMLDRKVDILNEVAGMPIQSRMSDGTSNVGNFHVTSSYGGFSLNRMANKAGASTTIIETTTKRDLFNLVNAMIDGAMLVKKSNGVQ